MNEKYDKNNSNEDINSKQQQKNYGLLIDYSKFQQKAINNNNKENIKKDLNNNLEKKIFNNNLKLQNEAPKKNSLEEFLSNDYESKSSFAVVETKNKENDINKNNNNIIKKDSNNLDNIFLNNEDDINLLTVNYKDLIKSNINNKSSNNTKNKKSNLYLNLNEENAIKNIDKYKDNKIKTMDNNIVKTPKKKNKYDKFVTNRNHNKEIERTKNNTNYSNDKYSLTSKLNKKEKVNSYVQLLKHNQNENKTNSKHSNIKNRNENSFILFNGVNANHNKSNFSDFSNNALSAINNPDNSINVMSVNDDISDTYSIKNKTNNKARKENILYTNKQDKYNIKPYHKKKNASYDDRMVKKFGDSMNRNNNMNNLNKNKNKLVLGNNDDKFSKYNNKKNNNGIKKDYDVINLLDNIKNKYQNQENKFIKKQNNMKNEINILKEKLKELSANEALYQVEIEKLKRRNNNNNKTNSNDIKTGKSGMNSSEEPFGHKLDNIIQKYNQNQNNNMNLSSFPNNINFQLLEIFGLDKSLFDGENISDFNDNNDYNEIFNKYPKLKNFIKLLIRKYKNEKEYRTRLEEKTIDIFTNDMKRINFLENKLKKYEGESRHSKVNPNSSLNYSYDNDNDNSEDNIPKNFCKSVDKIL